MSKIVLQKCFENWKQSCPKCITFKGDYFEGDMMVIDI